MKKISIGDFVVGNNKKFILIAGPCVLENEKTAMDTAQYLQKLTAKLKIPFIFKSSYDKANRTSIKSYRGPGAKKGLYGAYLISDRLIKTVSDCLTFGSFTFLVFEVVMSK